MSKIDHNKETGIESVEQALTKTEQFVEDNQKIITTIALSVLIIVAAFLAFKRLIIEPKEKAALAESFVAETYFQKDSFNLALIGDGNYLGFLDIMDEYKMTKTAKLAKYYAGICYLHLGDYEEAIDQLKGFKAKDIMVSAMALGAIGDAYVELGDYDQALSYYEKAAHHHVNNFTTPIFLNKAAQLYEENGNYKKAIALYENLKNDYPKSQEGRTAAKYIARAKGKL